MNGTEPVVNPERYVAPVLVRLEVEAFPSDDVPATRVEKLPFAAENVVVKKLVVVALVITPLVVNKLVVVALLAVK